MAAALDKVLNGDDSRWWKGYRFNPLVYEMLLTERPLRQGLTPPGFFDRTFGSLRGGPLERLPQGEYEQREAVE